MCRKVVIDELAVSGHDAMLRGALAPNSMNAQGRTKAKIITVAMNMLPLGPLWEGITICIATRHKQ